MKKLAEIQGELAKQTARSAWGRGVLVYASDLLEDIAERAEYEGKEPETFAELKDYALNGAKDWTQYSYGGSALIYDYDIARQLCTPSELKKTRDGERRPNSREEWLDVQARALNQAFNKLWSIARA